MAAGNHNLLANESLAAAVRMASPTDVYKSPPPAGNY